jgi:colanic acid/amylovoran biosynthesis glycosyltransferase
MSPKALYLQNKVCHKKIKGENVMNSQNIIIYRDSLLPISETFIKAQAENFQSFSAYYAGTKRVRNGLPLPKDKVIVETSNDSPNNSLYEVVCKITGLRFRLINQLKKVNPLLIHAHFGPDGVLAIPIAQKFNIPLVVTFHGYDATIYDEYLKKQSFNVRNYVRHKEKLIKTGTNFIAISNFIKNKLIQKGFPENKIITHYVGVDLSRLTPNPNIEREEIVLFVGRLVKNKGCEYLIKAMEIVQQTHPNVSLVVIGDGPEKIHLEQLATNKLRNVKFLGKQPYDEVIKWLNRAKIFSVPSIEISTGASEGFGMVFAEANAMGVPVVSFHTGGIPEAVAHETTGFLAPQKDWTQLAKYINLLLKNKELWDKFSKQGMYRVRKLFDIKEQTKKLEDLYREILGL